MWMKNPFQILSSLVQQVWGKPHSAERYATRLALTFSSLMLALIGVLEMSERLSRSSPQLPLCLGDSKLSCLMRPTTSPKTPKKHYVHWLRSFRIIVGSSWLVTTHTISSMQYILVVVFLISISVNLMNVLGYVPSSSNVWCQSYELGTYVTKTKCYNATSWRWLQTGVVSSTTFRDTPRVEK